MPRQPFTLADIARECEVRTGSHRLDGRAIGASVIVPPALQGRYPYNASAYAFLQQLRAAILEYGTVEFPGLPVNRSNHTLAQRSPREHAYSRNPYLTGYCQSPHQDTPPYPTAFWLGERRRCFATWVMSDTGLQDFMDFSARHPGMAMEDMHRALVPRSLAQGRGLLLNRNPGLLLIDNSQHQRLYHARTCDFAALAASPGFAQETPMYAYNEIGLLHYIDSLDERRGVEDRDAEEVAVVRRFIADERLTG